MYLNKLQQALDILNGSHVVAHDRRHPDAAAIPFVQTRVAKREVAVQPLYGVSITMQRSLTQLAKRVELVKTKRGRTMPQYVFQVGR